MLEPPNLPEATLLAALREHFDVSTSRLAFLPIGNDNYSWAYRVEAADGADYFLKVRGGILNVASLLVPRFLRYRGVTHVIAPLPTRTGALSASVRGASAGPAAPNEFNLILYPFVAGRMGAHGGLADQQWIAYGAAFRQIHAAAVPSALAAAMRREAFAPKWSPIVTEIDALIGATPFSDPAQQALAEFWQARRALIHTLLARAADLGGRLRAAGLPLVLCHADAHLWNILVEPDGALWVVDWDDTLLAPKECDLLFVVGGIGGDLVGPRETALFFEGYREGYGQGAGSAAADALALAYYRCERAIGDIGGYGERVLLASDIGAETRRDAVEGFMSLFEPGAIVDLARGSKDESSDSEKGRRCIR